ncbi:peptidoglycan-binding protein [Streptomyces sp. NPDC091280]|uniref:peptidoglycan-binding domain-containing protein n=1 Tax=Streptomyces sp. NPDC091280 TaxID=3365984 RepID=UPI003800EA4F
MKVIGRRLALGLASAALAGGGLAVAPTADAATTTAQVSAAYSSTTCTTVYYKNNALLFKQLVPNHNLAYGDYGDYCVKLLQKGINEYYGGTPLSVDGNFGPQTEAWVKKFQTDSPCSQNVDGQAGPNTNSCLEYLVGAYGPIYP